MKVIVISYSFTGNNEAIAAGVAEAFEAEHIKVSEFNRRSMSTIFLDILFNRTPKVDPLANMIKDHDLLVFVGPVWMGQVATPLRSYFKALKENPEKYAYVSISGGADGGNPKLADELMKRTGKAPAALIDLHIADLLPSNPKPNRNATSAYRLTSSDIKNLTDTAVKRLGESIVELNQTV